MPVRHLRVRERTCAALRGNNRSDFPKGSDTGTEINCTVLKMNKGICAVIREARVLPPCRPELTFNKPTAVPACLPDGLCFHGAAEPDRKQNAYTHSCILQQRNTPTCTYAGRNHPPQPHTYSTLYECQCTYT